MYADPVGASGSDKREAVVIRPLRRFTHDILAYIPTKLVLSGFSFLNVFVFTRFLNPEAYGLYSLIVAIIGPLVAVLTEWAAQPVGRYYSEYKAQNLPSYPATVCTLFTLVTAGGCVVAAGLFVFVSHQWGISMGMAAALLLLFQSLFQLFLPIIPASFEPGFYGVTQVLRVLIAFVLSLVLVLSIGPQPEFLLWGTVLSFAVALPLLFSRISQLVGKPRISFKVTPELWRFVRYGTPLMAWFFAAQLLNIGDRYVIQAFRGSAEVGIYSANYNFITGVASLLGAPVTTAAFPIIMYMWARNRREDLREIISTMTEWHLLLGIGLIGCSILGADSLFSLVLGKGFREGYTVLLPVLAGQILWQASILGHKGMELMEKTYWMLAFACVAAIANLLMNIVFVPIYGYVAAAYTTLLSYGIYSFLIWLFSRRFVPWHIPFKSVVVATIFAALAVIVAQAVKTGTMPTQALLRIVVFGGLYVTGIGIMKRKLLQQILRKGGTNAD